MNKIELIEKIYSTNKSPTLEEISSLLSIENNSKEFYKLLELSNKLSRDTFGNHGYVFAQIGINAEPCSKDCKFCSMGIGHYILDKQFKKTKEEVINESKSLTSSNINNIFLMATGDYPIEMFIEIATEVRNAIPKEVHLIANIGDFDIDIANKLLKIGINGIYHINRLREGIDTLIDKSVREQTIELISKSDLDLYYCIEPIGSEHSYDEIAVEILRAKELNIKAMAVMRRTTVANTPLANINSINALELTKIAAATNIIVKPSLSMNAHESIQMSLLAGINQLYAEYGSNPRDTSSNTETSRGLTPNKAWQMLEDANWYYQKKS